MLMYGKEASNRKQEIDRQHHTIPNKRTKDQKTSIVEMCITGYGIMDKEVSTNNCCKFMAIFIVFPGFCLKQLQQLFSDNS